MSNYSDRNEQALVIYYPYPPLTPSSHRSRPYRSRSRPRPRHLYPSRPCSSITIIKQSILLMDNSTSSSPPPPSSDDSEHDETTTHTPSDGNEQYYQQQHDELQHYQQQQEYQDRRRYELHQELQQEQQQELSLRATPSRSNRTTPDRTEPPPILPPPLPSSSSHEQHEDEEQQQEHEELSVYYRYSDSRTTTTASDAYHLHRTPSPPSQPSYHHPNDNDNNEESYHILTPRHSNTSTSHNTPSSQRTNTSSLPSFPSLNSPPTTHHFSTDSTPNRSNTTTPFSKTTYPSTSPLPSPKPISPTRHNFLTTKNPTSSAKAHRRHQEYQMRLAEARSNSVRDRLKAEHLAELALAFEEEAPLTYSSSGGGGEDDGGSVEGGGDAASSIAGSSVMMEYAGLLGGGNGGGNGNDDVNQSMQSKADHLAELQLMFEEEGVLDSTSATPATTPQKKNSSRSNSEEEEEEEEEEDGGGKVVATGSGMDEGAMTPDMFREEEISMHEMDEGSVTPITRTGSGRSLWYGAREEQKQEQQQVQEHGLGGRGGRWGGRDKSLVSNITSESIPSGGTLLTAAGVAVLEGGGGDGVVSDSPEDPNSTTASGSSTTTTDLTSLLHQQQQISYRPPSQSLIGSPCTESSGLGPSNASGVGNAAITVAVGDTGDADHSLSSSVRVGGVDHSLSSSIRAGGADHSISSSVRSPTSNSTSSNTAMVHPNFLQQQQVTSRSQALPQEQAQTQTQPELKPQVQSQAQPQTKPQAQPQAQLQTKPQAQPQAQAEVQPETKTSMIYYDLNRHSMSSSTTSSARTPRLSKIDVHSTTVAAEACSDASSLGLSITTERLNATTDIATAAIAVDDASTRPQVQQPRSQQPQVEDQAQSLPQESTAQLSLQPLLQPPLQTQSQAQTPQSEIQQAQTTQAQTTQAQTTQAQTTQAQTTQAQTTQAQPQVQAQASPSSQPQSETTKNLYNLSSPLLSSSLTLPPSQAQTQTQTQTQAQTQASSSSQPKSETTETEIQYNLSSRSLSSSLTTPNTTPPKKVDDSITVSAVPIVMPQPKPHPIPSGGGDTSDSDDGLGEPGIRSRGLMSLVSSLGGSNSPVPSTAAMVAPTANVVDPSSRSQPQAWHRLLESQARQQSERAKVHSSDTPLPPPKPNEDSSAAVPVVPVVIPTLESPSETIHMAMPPPPQQPRTMNELPIEEIPPTVPNPAKNNRDRVNNALRSINNEIQSGSIYGLKTTNQNPSKEENIDAPVQINTLPTVSTAATSSSAAAAVAPVTRLDDRNDCSTNSQGSDFGGSVGAGAAVGTVFGAGVIGAASHRSGPQQQSAQSQPHPQTFSTVSDPASTSTQMLSLQALTATFQRPDKEKDQHTQVRTDTLPTVPVPPASTAPIYVRDSDGGSNDWAIIGSRGMTTTSFTSSVAPSTQLRPQSQPRSRSTLKPSPESLSRSRPQSQPRSQLPQTPSTHNTRLDDRNDRSTNSPRSNFGGSFAAGAAVGAGVIGATSHSSGPQQQQQLSAQEQIQQQIKEQIQQKEVERLQRHQSQQLQQQQIKELYLELEDRQDEQVRLQKIHDLEQDVQLQEQRERQQKLKNSIFQPYAVQNSFLDHSDGSQKGLGGLDTSQEGVENLTNQGGVGAIRLATGNSSGVDGDHVNGSVDDRDDRTIGDSDSRVGKRSDNDDINNSIARFKRSDTIARLKKEPVGSQRGLDIIDETDVDSGFFSEITETTNNQSKGKYMAAPETTNNQSKGEYMADSGFFSEVTETTSNQTENIQSEGHDRRGAFTADNDQNNILKTSSSEVGTEDKPLLSNPAVEEEQDNSSPDFNLSIGPISQPSFQQTNTSWQQPPEQRRVPLLRLSEGAQKWGVLFLIFFSLSTLVLTVFLTGRTWRGRLKPDRGDGSSPTMAPSGDLNIFGDQYRAALEILIDRNISTTANLPYGCFNTRCDDINPPTNITIYHKALDQCVFTDKLLGDALTNFVFEVGPPVDPIAVVQCYAISLLGFSLGATQWTKNDGWVDPNDNECTWYGITCNGKEQITIIDLPLDNLNGTFPGRELFQLEKLEELKLYGNKIDGNLMEIGECETLRELWFSDTTLLSGTIPTSIGRLSNLVNIYLSDNKITGSLPSEIGQLSMLESFSVYKNSMTGSIPTEFSNLTNLQRLFLDHNRLNGPIPKLPNLGSLRDFRVDHNKLSDKIPTALAILANLEVLNLDNNALTGGIPTTWIIQNSKLEQFTGQNNSLSGAIPTELFELPQLTFLRLDDNKLNSIIPDTICADPNSNKLKTLDLSNNEHMGVIPNSLENCAALETLKLSKNKLEGPIPPWIRNLRNLETLYLDGNDLSGQIPNDFGLTPKLTFVRLQENGINGQINEALCDNVKELLADCPIEVQITCCNRTPGT